MLKKCEAIIMSVNRRLGFFKSVNKKFIIFELQKFSITTKKISKKFRFRVSSTIFSENIYGDIINNITEIEKCAIKFRKVSDSQS